MPKFLFAIPFAVTAAFSGGLVTFTAGSPAKADEVNRNFTYLDSAKASVSSVDVLTSAVSTKADKSALESKTDDSRTDSLAKALIAKADTSVWRAVKDSAASMRAAIGKTSTIDWSGVSNKPAVLINDTAGIMDWASKNFPGTVPVAGIKGQGPADYGAAVFMRRDLAAGVSVMDFHTDGVINSWGSQGGGIQTNSVTRIDGSGNGSLSTLAVGTTNTYGGTAAFQYNGTGGDWNEGIVLVPTPKYNGASIFFRANQTNSDSAICFGRRGGGLGVTMQHLKFSPFSIDAYGNTTIGGILTTPKIASADLSVTDLRVAGSLKTAPTEPWADYVFEPGYKPMALKEIEAFAKANGHLPEVPSAAEVQKDGIDLARMNAILLKKIEELTLHAIEQEKKMEALQAEVREMKTSR